MIVLTITTRIVIVILVITATIVMSHEARYYIGFSCFGNFRFGSTLRSKQEQGRLPCLVGNGGLDYGDYWGLYRDYYYTNPFPHSLWRRGAAGSQIQGLLLSG